MKYAAGFIAVACSLATAGASQAHHSGAMFDRTRVVVLTGTVKTFSYQAPHTWISIIGAPNNGADAKQWDAEAGSPGMLVGLGITRDTLKPGEKISMGIYPLRDGRNAGAMVYVTTPDGHVYGTKLDERGAPITH